MVRSKGRYEEGLWPRRVAGAQGCRLEQEPEHRTSEALIVARSLALFARSPCVVLLLSHSFVLAFCARAVRCQLT